MVWNNLDINHTVEKEIVSWANKYDHGIYLSSLWLHSNSLHIRVELSCVFVWKKGNNRARKRKSNDYHNCVKRQNRTFVA